MEKAYLCTFETTKQKRHEKDCNDSLYGTVVSEPVGTGQYLGET